MSVNSIGPFHFVRLDRPPELVKQTLITRSRPGVNGVMLQRLGVRAMPFEITSMVDAPTVADAYSLYWQYRLLVGASAVPMWWAGLAIQSHLFFVMNVSPVDIRRILRGHGGLNGLSYARTVCTWTLQPIATT